ncbi:MULTISPECIES: hypothetical protein [unclassified Streptomyces]
MAYLLAFMTSDTGHHGLAQQYYDLALALAHEAGDRALYAITLRAMSVQALGLGYIHQAQSLADSAVEFSGRDDPAVLAFTLAQRAHTHAAQALSNRAMSDIMGSAAAHEQAESHGSAFTDYPRAGLEYKRARTLQLLHRPEQAILAFQSSIKHRDPNQHRPYALTQARLAETFLSCRQLDAACLHWHLFLDHYPYVVGSNEAGRALARMLQQARSFTRERQALELIDRGRPLSVKLPRY